MTYLMTNIQAVSLKMGFRILSVVVGFCSEANLKIYKTPLRFEDLWQQTQVIFLSVLVLQFIQTKLELQQDS